MLLVAIVVGHGAHADEPRHHVRVVVSSTGGCTDASRFFTALALRSDKIALDPASPDSVEVEVDATGAGATGRLVVRQKGQESAPRSLEGASCDEVVRALSLVAALAFDPEARLDPPRVAPVAPASPAPLAPTPPVRTRGASPSPVSAAYRMGVGGGATGLGLGGESVSLGALGFVELARDAPGLSPVFRLGFARASATSSTTSATFGLVAADLALTLVRASGCVARLDFGLGVRVRPCLGLEAGALDATPRAPVVGASRSTPWLGVGPSVRMEWEIGRYLFVEAEGAVTFPLVRDELGAEPRVMIYRAPVVVPSAGFGAGARFP